MEGLYFESSATTPYHFLNAAELSKAPSNPERNLPYKALDVADGVKHLQLRGGRYYMAVSQDALAQAHANPDLRLVAVSKPWEIFEINDSAEVTPLRAQPAVIRNAPKGSAAWMDVGVHWFQQDPTTWDVPIAAHGPSDWQRIRVTNDKATEQMQGKAKVVGSGIDIQQPLPVPVRETTVSHIKLSDDRISFDVDKPGSPVLVKASYFPNWEASGAKGPYRVAPNQMVVVPTSRHVSLHYGYTSADRLGYSFTLLGIVALITLVRLGTMTMPPASDGGEQLTLFDEELDFRDTDAGGNGERLGPEAWPSWVLEPSRQSTQRMRARPTRLRAARLRIGVREGRVSVTSTGRSTTPRPARSARMTSSVSNRSVRKRQSSASERTASLRMAFMPWVSDTLNPNPTWRMVVNPSVTSFRGHDRLSTDPS